MFPLAALLLAAALPRLGGGTASPCPRVFRTLPPVCFNALDRSAGLDVSWGGVRYACVKKCLDADCAMLAFLHSEATAQVHCLLSSDDVMATCACVNTSYYVATNPASSQASPTCAQVTCGASYFPITGKAVCHYLYVAGDKTTSTSNCNFAAVLNGLVEISTQAALDDVVANKGGASLVWNGATYSTGNTRWEWDSDGSEATIPGALWKPGEPTAGVAASRYCAAVDTTTSKLQTVDCTDATPFAVCNVV